MSLTVTQLCSHIGARVDGVNLGGNLDTAAVERIYQALLRHKVIIFRDQQHLDDEQHVAFAGLLGAVVFNASAEPLGTRESAITRIDSEYGKAVSLHTDGTFLPNIPKASVLRPVILPPSGGSTLWASTVAAYAQLPEPLQRFVEDLWALHGIEAHDLRAEHPVVHVHPETGERALLAGSFLRGFHGLDGNQSNVLLELLQRRITMPQNTMRWNWKPGDVAVWDNRATQHCVADDFGEHRRLMHRVTLAGDAPVDIRGRRSRPVGPQPSRPRRTTIAG